MMHVSTDLLGGLARRVWLGLLALLLAGVGLVVAAPPAAAASFFDLSVVPLGPVIAGSSVEVEVRVYNAGPDVATSSTAELTLPAGVTAAGPACISPSPCLIGAFGTINVGETATRRLTLEIAPDFVLENGGGGEVAQLPFQLSVDYSDGAQSGNRNLVVREQADLRITAVADDTEVPAGESVTYTILVDNLGPSVARDVTVSSTLLGVEGSNNVTITSCSFSVALAGGLISQFGCVVGTQFEAQFGTQIATFGTDRVDPLAIVDPGGGDPPFVTGRLRGAFRLTVDEAMHLTDETRVISATDDPDLSNNQSLTTLNVSAAADLSVVTAAPAAAYPGSSLTYDVTASNDGPSTALNTVVDVTLPEGVALVSATVPGGTCIGGPSSSIVCRLGVMADQEDRDITVVGRIDSGVPPGATLTGSALISSDVLDLDNSDDGAQSITDVEAAPLVLEPLTPARAFDTRDGTGGVPVGKIAANSDLAFAINGTNGVPVGAAAVSLNVTVVEPDAAGHLAVFPCAGGQPPTSNLNFSAGQTIANAVLTPVDGAGEICFRSTTPTHVIADVAAWAPAGEGFNPLAPDRVFDTRTGAGGVPVGRRPAGSVLSFELAGAGGVPGTGATAVAVNLTSTGATAGGHVTAFPCGETPLASNLNVAVGETRPNLVIAPLSASGRVCLYTSAPMHLVADVSGWFEDGSGLHTLTPTRRVDTRTGIGAPAQRVAAGTHLEVDLTGSHGVPSTGVAAVVLNLTAAGGLGSGYVTAYPCGDRPTTSNLNFITSAAAANSVIAPVDEDGNVCFYVSRPVHLVIDVSGYL